MVTVAVVVPSAPASICSDCPKRATAGRYCNDHQHHNQRIDNSRTRDSERYESNPYRRLYSQARWRGVRACVLQRDPLCMVCGSSASTIVDHVIRAVDWVAQHGGDMESFYCEQNLQGLCKLDHDIKSRRGE